MTRVLNVTVWVDGVEYPQGSSPTGSVAAQIGDHLWEDVSVAAPGEATTVDLDRLASVAEAAYSRGEMRDVVRALLSEVGIPVPEPALTDESQPQVEEQGPSQFESVPVTEDAVTPPAEVGGDSEPTPDAEDLEAAPGSESFTPSPDREDSTEAAPSEQPESAVPVPNRGGKGSSRENWQEYAEANDVEVTDDMERNDIIDACREAGVKVD